MVFERSFVRMWNQVCRTFHFGRPVYRYPIVANFMGLSTETSSFINKLYMKHLPLKGSMIEIDVLGNRRHQLIGVFMPAVFLVTCAFQFSVYHFTRAPTVVKQTPAPGWEIPEGYNYQALPPTPANVALWRKKQEMNDEGWNYTMGDVTDLTVGTHPWTLHAHEPHAHTMAKDEE